MSGCQGALHHCRPPQGFDRVAQALKVERNWRSTAWAKCRGKRQSSNILTTALSRSRRSRSGPPWAAAIWSSTSLWMGARIISSDQESQLRVPRYRSQQRSTRMFRRIRHQGMSISTKACPLDVSCVAPSESISLESRTTSDCQAIGSSR